MGTDTVVAKSASQRGMAMLIVLGAIVLVTLFGYVGLNLAGRDQNLSGDLNDIKSRDEAAMASLQFSINRLIEDPDQLVTLLNGFISTGRGNGGQPTSTWVVFDPSTKAIALQKNEPDWLPLSTDANNQSAMKLQILGVGAGDSTAPVTDRKDSLGVHVSFRGLARGRRGDEKEVLAAYRIHGLSVDYRTDSTRYTIPNYAFYLGSFLNSSNLGTHVIGDVYIAGGNTLNATANDTVQGNFKWQGDPGS